MLYKSKKIKIGLALGSGGPRGLAHIGIIKSLVKNNIPIDYIAGSSAGAMAGGYYAASKNIDEIEKLVISTNRRKILSMFLEPSFKGGIVAGNKMEKFIEEYIGDINFSDLKVPFIAVATDLITKKPVLINKGRVSKAIRISGSMPIVFKPVKKGEKILVDGGLSNPVPVDVVKKMGADFVIAVNLSDYYIANSNDKFGFYSIMNNTISVFSYNLSRNNIKQADFVVPAKVENVDWVSIFKNKGRGIITENQKLMDEMIPKLKKKFKEKAKP
jgi:NTE family protein